MMGSWSERTISHTGTENCPDSYGRQLLSFTSQITVTIEQGQLTKYVYNLTVVLAYGSGGMQITWVDTVTF